MANIQVAVINQSTSIADGEVQAAIPALQTQVSRDFAPVWSVDAQLTFVPNGSQPAADAWWLVILDNSDQAGALGYHDLTPNFLPLGKVFAGSDKQLGYQWTVTASHELLEMLGDPDINLCATQQKSNGALRLYAYEVADACEADQYGYLIDGVLVSDFVFPSWFESNRPANSAQFDFQKKIGAPFQLLPGGYIGIYDTDSSNGWTQISAQASKPTYDMRARVGSRRERRRVVRDHWLPSQPVRTVPSRAALALPGRKRARLRTHRSPVISLMQSALHQTLKRRAMTAVRMSADHPEMIAFCEAIQGKISAAAASAPTASRFAAAASASPPAALPPTFAASSVLDGAKLYAELAWAEITGNTARRQVLENELRYSTVDPLWLECWTTYLSWKESATQIPYIAYKKLSDFAVNLPAPKAADGRLVVGIIGDWGTGMEDASFLLDRLLTQNVDLIIHLGDIYYSGTVPEVSENFMNIMNAANVKVPIYTLAGNHDMYAGGAGYYKLIALLNQPASYFCLRNDFWQILGMDTGYNDSDVFTVNTNLTDVGPNEGPWHLDKINNAGGRKTILLSHHQLFSPFDTGVGEVPGAGNLLANNVNLFATFGPVMKNIALWLFGHEHSCNIFKPCNGLQRGRCVGASGVPEMAPGYSVPTSPPLSPGQVAGGPPLDMPVLVDDPAAPGTPLKLKSNSDKELYHCFAVLRLDSKSTNGMVDYYQIDSSNKAAETLFFTENI
ncbi:MAG TPA: metallophosphoesterase [Verrucomicrobiae bacterium]